MSNWAGPEERWPDDDKYTVLFNETVKAYQACAIYGEVLSRATGHQAFCDGMIHAYALLTGDPEDAVRRLVARAAAELVPS